MLLLFCGEGHVRWSNVDFHTCNTASPAALASSIAEPPYPKIPSKSAETSVGDDACFSSELHRSEVLLKRPQVQIFLRCEEEGHGVKSGRGRRRSEGGPGGDREVQECAGGKRRNEGESTTERVCVPLGVKW